MSTESHADRHVRLLTEWLAEACPSVGEMIFVQSQALAGFLEIIPVEERPPVVQRLLVALEDAMDALDLPYEDLDLEAQISTRH